LAQDDETRADSTLRWIKNNKVFSALIVLGIVVIALAAFQEAVGRLVRAGRDLLGTDDLTKVPPQESFDAWAREFYAAERGSIGPALSDRSSEFAAASRASQPSYATAIQAIHVGLLSYRRQGHPNIYIDIPPAPSDLFGAEAAQFRGGVTFSRRCSWLLQFDNPEHIRQRQGPNLVVTLMNGDGHVQGGSEVGTVAMRFDFDNAVIHIERTGLASSLLVDLPAFVRPANFERVVSYATKLLIEHQLSTCEMDDTV